AAVAPALTARADARAPAAAPEPKPAPRRTAFAKLGQGLRAALESRSDSPREISAGLAEIIKCAAIADPELFAWLERHVDDLRAQQQHAVAHAVQRIQQLRDQIEAEDRQQHRSPSPLDFGMALGHVVESVLGFGRYLHGEAIGLGMLLAADLGQSLGVQSAESAERLRRLLQSAGLPMTPPRAPTARWLELLPLDGETGAQHMRCVLLSELGAPLNQAVPREQVLQALERSGALAA
ncbi:3-dehydroquinate synthase family protein, partial [Thiomonas sp.]